MSVSLPKIIQGGMGVAVSSWQLANAVSRRGELGVVSGTGLGIVIPSRLQDGDEGGHVRRALNHFPVPAVAQQIIDKYFIDGGKSADQPYKRPVMWTVNPPDDLVALTVAANFVEVWLAKEGHNNPVGINLLEKVQLPTLASLYGAMLAGVDYVLMGAGIPMQVPGALDKFVTHESASYRLDVLGGDDVSISFDPQALFAPYGDIAAQVGELKRPQFLPIVSSFVLARALSKRANGEVNGFVIEMPIAGGHNAPPRGDFQLNERGEPIYTEKDAVDLSKFRDMGLPFWLAGGYGSAEKLQEALAEGAAGIQVGTAFAYCDESGLEPTVRERIVAQVLEGDVEVLTSATASPTGFPFKVVDVPGTVTDADVYMARERVCDIGYLRHVFAEDDGKVNYRCPAGPIAGYTKKGGKAEDTVGRVCLCNQLFASAGMPQVRRGGAIEPMVITSGDDLPHIKQFVPDGQTHYTAGDVLDVLLAAL